MAPPDCIRSMADWFVEVGIGETRAALIDAGCIVEMRIERDDDGPRLGEVWDARLTTKLGDRRGFVALGNDEAMLEPLPPGVPEGGLVRVEVVREAVPERGRPRLAKVRATGQAAAVAARISEGPRLANLSPAPLCYSGKPFEEAGWDEAISEASTGRVAFKGGALSISPTPAMTLIDIDGDLPAAELVSAGARAAATAIRKFDIGGSIGIDLPTVADRTVRQAAGKLFDALLPLPFERTAVNGFGFIQIVRPRRRPSIVERVQSTPLETAALALLRQVQRTPGAGRRKLVAAPRVAEWLQGRPALVLAAERLIGAGIDVAADTSLGLAGGYVHAAQI